MKYRRRKDSPRLVAAIHFSTCVPQPGTFSTNYLNFYLARLRRPVDYGPNSLDVAAVVSPAATANDVRLEFADVSA